MKHVFWMALIGTPNGNSAPQTNPANTQLSQKRPSEQLLPVRQLGIPTKSVTEMVHPLKAGRCGSRTRSSFGCPLFTTIYVRCSLSQILPHVRWPVGVGSQLWGIHPTTLNTLTASLDRTWMVRQIHSSQTTGIITQRTIPKFSQIGIVLKYTSLR